MVKISYVATPEPPEASKQASLADTLEEMEKYEPNDESDAMPTNREVLRQRAMEVLRSSKDPVGPHLELLNLLAGDGKDDDEWCTMSIGKVHCESELAWRMDDRNKENGIEVVVPHVLHGTRRLTYTVGIILGLHAHYRCLYTLLLHLSGLH